MKVFIGNLSFEAEEADLREAFGRIGKVDSVEIVRDRATNKSKGFGFVGFAMSEDAEAAVHDLDGRDLMGRKMRVEIANGDGGRKGGAGRGGRGRDRGRERGAVSGRY